MAEKISAKGLDVAKARLSLAMGYSVEWKQFAEWADLSPHTVSGILNGRSGGSPSTLTKIVGMLRQRGVNILTTDLLEPAE